MNRNNMYTKNENSSAAYKYQLQPPGPGTRGSFATTNDEFFDAQDYVTSGGSHYSFVTAAEYEDARSQQYEDMDDNVNPSLPHTDSENEQHLRPALYANPAYASDEDEGGFTTPKHTSHSDNSARSTEVKLNMQASSPDSNATTPTETPGDDDFGFKYRPAVAAPRPLQPVNKHTSLNKNLNNKSPLSSTRDFSFSVEDTLAIKAATKQSQANMATEYQHKGIILETNLDSEFDKSSVASSYFPNPHRQNMYQPKLPTNVEHGVTEMSDTQNQDSETLSPYESDSTSSHASSDVPPVNVLRRWSGGLGNGIVQESAPVIETDIPKIHNPQVMTTGRMPKYRPVSAVLKASKKDNRMLARLDTDFEADTDAEFVETTPNRIHFLENNGTLKQGYNKKDYDENGPSPIFTGYRNPEHRHSVQELSPKHNDVTLRTRSLNALNFSMQSLSNTNKTVIIPGPARRASLRRSKLALNNPGSLYSLTMTGDLGKDNLGFETVNLDINDNSNEFHHDGPVLHTKKPTKSPVDTLKNMPEKKKKYVLIGVVTGLVVLVALIVIIILAVKLSP